MFNFLIKFYRSKNDADKTSRSSQKGLIVQSDDKSQKSQELVYPSMWREIQQIAHPITFNALKDFYNVE